MAVSNTTKSKKLRAKTPVKKGVASMAAKSTKSTRSAKASNKSTRKLPSFFSFANKKFVVLLVAVVAVAGLGTWKLYTTQAAYDGKTGQEFPSVKQCAAFKPPMQWGSEATGQGSCIKTVQKFLNVSGTTRKQIQVDGLYYDETRDAVKDYQGNRNFYHNEGLAIDGKVGTYTWDSIIRFCGANSGRDGRVNQVCNQPAYWR